MTSCMVSTVYCHSLNSKLFVSWAKKHKKKLHFRFSVVHSRRDVIFVSPFLTPLTFQSKFLLLYPVLSGLFQTHVLKHYIIIIFLLFFSSCFKYFSLSPFFYVWTFLSFFLVTIFFPAIFFYFFHSFSFLFFLFFVLKFFRTDNFSIRTKYHYVFVTSLCFLICLFEFQSRFMWVVEK